MVKEELNVRRYNAARTLSIYLSFNKLQSHHVIGDSRGNLRPLFDSVLWELLSLIECGYLMLFPP